MKNLSGSNSSSFDYDDRPSIEEKMLLRHRKSSDDDEFIEDIE